MVGSTKEAQSGKMRKPAEEAKRGTRPRYEPTTEEIAAACAAIQEGWSEKERVRRYHPRCA